MNHASSPNLPNLYLERNISFGNPHATDTKCGLTFVLGSTSVEKPLRNARENRRVVQQIDCISNDYIIFFFFSFWFNRKCSLHSISLNPLAVLCNPKWLFIFGNWNALAMCEVRVRVEFLFHFFLFTSSASLHNIHSLSFWFYFLRVCIQFQWFVLNVIFDGKLIGFVAAAHIFGVGDLFLSISYGVCIDDIIECDCFVFSFLLRCECWSNGVTLFFICAHNTLVANFRLISHFFLAFLNWYFSMEK